MVLAVESRKFIEKTLDYLEKEFKKSLMMLEDNLVKFLSQKIEKLKKYENELENELLRMNLVSNRKNSQILLKKMSSSEIKAKSLKETIECMLSSAEGKNRGNEVRDLHLEKEGFDPNFFENVRKNLNENFFEKMQEKTINYLNEVNFLIKEIGQVIL